MVGKGPAGSGAPVSDMASYVAARNELIQACSAASRGLQAPLSAEEEVVATHMRDLLARVTRQGTDGHCFSFSKRNFLGAIDEIERSELFPFLKKMPKGGILHIHDMVMGDFRWMISSFTYQDTCFIYRGDDGLHAKGALAIFDGPPPTGWVRTTQERQASGDSASYDRALHGRLVMKPDDTMLPNPWTAFDEKFLLLGKLFENEAFYREYLLDALTKIARDDHISHIEIRVACIPRLVDLYRSVLAELAARGHDISVRLILYSVRHRPATESHSAFLTRIRNDAIETGRLMASNPDLVSGYDLVGEEDAGLPTLAFAPVLLEANEMLKAKGMSLSLYLHGGETRLPLSDRLPGPGGGSPPSFNNNMVDLLLLGTKRVGHGFSVACDPHLMGLYREKGTCFEISPISNQVLGYVDDLRAHPALALIRAGLPVCINPDDPALFGYVGVTHDFWAAVVAWNLDLPMVKSLIMNSLRHASLDAQAAERLRHRWQASWDAFIHHHAAAVKSAAAAAN